MGTVALCLITWNEIDGVRHDISRLDRSKFDQIYCIDGGSTDGTVEYLTENGITVYKQKKKGLNQACIEGVEHCDCDAFVFFHPKGTIPVEDAYKFRSFFEQGYELVVASRIMKGARNEEDDHLLRPRKWMVYGLSVLSAVFFRREGRKIVDVLHGFRGMTVDAFWRLGIPNKYRMSIDIEMVCRSYKKHIKRIELPTRESSRLAGKSHFTIMNAGIYVVMYVFWEKLFNR